MIKTTNARKRSLESLKKPPKIQKAKLWVNVRETKTKQIHR